MMILFRTLLLLLLGSTLVFGAEVSGRVVLQDDPLAGVTVAAWSDLDFSGEPVASSAPTGGDGIFHLDLPPGDYALFARDAGRGLFAFYGRNPLTVGTEKVWAGLQAVRVGTIKLEPYDDEYRAAIEGTVRHGGQAVAGALVYLYLDVAEALKGQGYRMSAPTGPDGFFAFDNLPESDYHLVARKREDGSRQGPVRSGDLYGIFSGNPLSARAGKVVAVELPLVVKQQDAASSETFGRSSNTLVRGRVVDTAGKPVANLHVFAYTDRVIGHQRPAALSAPTGPDGRFLLHLPGGGTYFVGARENYGDSPAPGERFGMYEETADHGLQVETGASIEEISITVETIQLF